MTRVELALDIFSSLVTLQAELEEIVKSVGCYYNL
jgi:hypothetical protein